MRPGSVIAGPRHFSESVSGLRGAMVRSADQADRAKCLPGSRARARNADLLSVGPLGPRPHRAGTEGPGTPASPEGPGIEPISPRAEAVAEPLLHADAESVRPPDVEC